MTVTSVGIVDGVIADCYGKHGDCFYRGMPSYSLPFEIHNPPAGTVSFAIVLEDKDAVPVSGFSWIHWTACNIKTRVVGPDASASADFVQGANSWSGKLGDLERMETARYGGMAPPDAPHEYELHVYALDSMLELEKGFYLNELYRKMRGHVLSSATIYGTYSN